MNVDTYQCPVPGPGKATCGVVVPSDGVERYELSQFLEKTNQKIKVIFCEKMEFLNRSTDFNYRVVVEEGGLEREYHVEWPPIDDAYVSTENEELTDPQYDCFTMQSNPDRVFGMKVVQEVTFDDDSGDVADDAKSFLHSSDKKVVGLWKGTYRLDEHDFLDSLEKLKEEVKKGTRVLFDSGESVYLFHSKISMRSHSYKIPCFNRGWVNKSFTQAEKTKASQLAKDALRKELMPFDHGEIITIDVKCGENIRVILSCDKILYEFRTDLKEVKRILYPVREERRF